MINFRRLRSASPLFALVLLSSGVSAQTLTAPPALDQILRQLQANLDRYDAHVPSFFCDEHVVSQVTPNRREDTAVTDSIFRLKRTANKDRTFSLAESREVRLVNGKPATSQDISGPSVISGAFEGGLVVVSLNQTSCMNYSLQRIHANRPGDPYVIRFASVLNPDNKANCILQEEGKGRVVIDPKSMQITRMELDTPHHVINPETSNSPAVIGPWKITVDYAPVQFGLETFWLPARISSFVTGGSGTFHEVEWSFRATYRNFHKLEVKSRVVSAPDLAAPSSKVQ
jgi:hypothetical protein